MNKLIPLLLVVSLFASSTYNGSTTAAVTLVGGILKASSVVVDKKYPRKDCPVCKGTGKYLSGDGIKMVDCGYCEVPKTQTPEQPQSVLRHPPVCNGPECRTQVIKK
jgi:hypothetical protein